jgi:sodium-independent sulfate anion transporter 11
LRHLQGDFIAGITVGLMIIPQGLAYAKLAELPTQVSFSLAHAFVF